MREKILGKLFITSKKKTIHKLSKSGIYHSLKCAWMVVISIHHINKYMCFYNYKILTYLSYLQNLHDDIVSKKPAFKQLAETASTLMGLVGEDEAKALADRLQEVTDRWVWKQTGMAWP